MWLLPETYVSSVWTTSVFLCQFLLSKCYWPLGLVVIIPTVVQFHGWWWLNMFQDRPFLASIPSSQRTLYLSSTQPWALSIVQVVGVGDLASPHSFLSSHEDTMTQVCIASHSVALVLFLYWVLQVQKRPKPHCYMTVQTRAVNNTDDMSYVPNKHT